MRTAPGSAPATIPLNRLGIPAWYDGDTDINSISPYMFLRILLLETLRCCAASPAAFTDFCSLTINTQAFYIVMRLCVFVNALSGATISAAAPSLTEPQVCIQYSHICLRKPAYCFYFSTGGSLHCSGTGLPAPTFLPFR